jgi:Polysaccharide deacetylase
MKPELRIALTFDDGPHPKNTEALINILSERIVPATFFVLGQNAKRWPDILRLMHEAGHEIGNHGWSHASFDLKVFWRKTMRHQSFGRAFGAKRLAVELHLSVKTIETLKCESKKAWAWLTPQT